MNIEGTTDVRTNRFNNLRRLPYATPEAVLEELFRLLEAYGPTWYTEDLHDRAIAALSERDGRRTPKSHKIPNGSSHS